MTSEFAISIVIPSLNEAERLPLSLETLAAQLGNLNGTRIEEVIVIDDGSTDDTAVVAAGFEDKLPGLQVEVLPQNRGKGFAIRRGIGLAKSEWVLIADADMSTPWDQVVVLADEARAGSFDIAIGSRGMRESNITTRQHFVREYLGRSFNVLIRLLTRLPYSDTQCGFKLARRHEVAAYLDSLTVDRFAWDVEFLILAQDRGLKIIEVPVTWEHRDASRVNPVFDGLEMAWTVLKLRLGRLFRRS